jgi:hypothetical protein
MNGHRPAKGNPSREQNPAYGLLQPIFYRNNVNDQQAWIQAVKIASDHYFQLPTMIRAELDVLINDIMRFKEQLSELALSSGSADICRTCGGKCCLNGKYHFSVLDLLAYRNTLLEPILPEFTAYQRCPYSCESGCLMPPRFRPMTCVVFNCELIENQMKPSQCEALYECEKQLREAIRQACRIAGRRLDRALLLSCEI